MRQVFLVTELPPITDALLLASLEDQAGRLKVGSPNQIFRSLEITPKERKGSKQD